VKLDPRTWLIDLRKVKLTGWRLWTAYGVFFVLAFVVALRLTFPVEAVKERLVLDAAAQGYQVTVNDISPAGLVGIRAREVTVITAEGTRIPLEELQVGVRILPTLIGRKAYSFDVSLFDGRITGTTEASKTFERYQARVAGIDLARAGAIRATTGLDMGGILSGTLDVALDLKDPAKSTGTIDFQVKDAAIRGGSLTIPGMDGGLTVPPVKLGTLAAKGALKGSRADLATLESKGDELTVVADQVFVQLQPRVAFSPLSGRVKVRPTDAFWRKDQVAPLKPLIEMALASARGPDGGFGFQVYGTLARPQARPTAF
jgi:type II secretion system protein N